MKHCQLSLTVFDRISIPSILPEIGKYEVGVVVKDIKDKIRLTQEEITLIGLKSSVVNADMTNIQWDQTKAPIKTFDLTQLEFELIQGSLRDLSEKEKLRTEMPWLALYEKFINIKPSKDK